eukprot:8814871-Karenia_brevis.AAC.1
MEWVDLSTRLIQSTGIWWSSMLARTEVLGTWWTMAIGRTTRKRVGRRYFLREGMPRNSEGHVLGSII